MTGLPPRAEDDRKRRKGDLWRQSQKVRLIRDSRCQERGYFLYDWLCASEDEAPANRQLPGDSPVRPFNQGHDRRLAAARLAAKVRQHFLQQRQRLEHDARAAETRLWIL